MTILIRLFKKQPELLLPSHLREIFVKETRLCASCGKFEIMSEWELDYCCYICQQYICSQCDRGFYDDDGFHALCKTCSNCENIVGKFNNNNLI